MELSLVNYQAWEKANLGIEGLTVVVGPSNRGKSSFGRAVRGAFRNDILPGHIKLGTSGVEVSVKFHNLDLKVTRGSKAKDGTIYQVGDEKFEKLGGDVPQAVKDHNFGPVVVDKVSIDPVFAGQFDAQFLLGSSPAELNAVLNAFASTEKLDRGRKVIGTRVNETNTSAKALAPQISALEEQDADLTEKLTASEPKLAEILELHQRVTLLEKAIAAVDRLKAARALHDRAISQQAALIRLEKVVGKAVTAYKAAVRTTTVIVARQVVQQANQQADAVQVVELALPRALAANRALTALAQVIGATTILAANGGLQLALVNVEEALKPALRVYKALVRLKAAIEADPATPRSQAQAIQDISTANAEKILQAGIIIKKLLGLGADSQVTREALDTLTTDFDALTTETATLTAQLESARQAGTVVTCPKCNHEFTPGHAH